MTMSNVCMNTSLFLSLTVRDAASAGGYVPANSTSKCNKKSLKSFPRCFKIQHFARSVVKPLFELINSLWRNILQRGFLRDITANEAVGVFHGSLFPAVIGLAKVRAHIEVFIEGHVLHVLGSVVIGHRS